MRTILRVAMHAAVFAIALFVFVLGLGIGLAVNPAAGTLLWVLAGLIGVANVIWIVAGRRSRALHNNE